jgi:hypothetical protein
MGQNTDFGYLAEEFALIEASYGIVQVLQAFPTLRLPPDEPQEPMGQESQSLTIVASSANGCKSSARVVWVEKSRLDR